MSKIKMPEPITADEIRFGMRRIDADQRYIEVEQAQEYAQAVRDEAVKRARPTYFGDGYQAGWNSALEQAMKVIESANKNFIMTADNAGAARAAITRCGDAIRALKEQS